MLHRARATALLLLFTLTALGCASHSADGPEPIRASSNFLHPPFSSRDEQGRPVGIEIELVAAAAARLGREVVWVDRPFGDLIPGVARGDADVAASTIGINAERAKVVAFTRPYFETTIVALTRQGDGEPRLLAELADRRIGTERATSTVSAAKLHVPDAVRVLDRDDGKTWAEMLADGRIDAVVLDRSHADKFMRDAGTRFHVIEEPLQVERFGLVVHHEASALKSALDSVIEARGER